MFISGKFFKDERLKAGLSLKEAAMKSGLTDTKIQRIENDLVKEASPSAIKSLCGLYGINVVEVFLKLGWIDRKDLKDYTFVIKRADQLTDKELDHLQKESDFMISYHKETK